MSINLNITKKTQTAKLPDWMNAVEIIDAAKGEREEIASQSGLQKTASNNLTTVSYRDSHGHVIFADDHRITAQVERGVTELIDDYGKPLTIHKQIPSKLSMEHDNLHSEASVKHVDSRERENTPGYVVNSIVSRHTQYKALQALSDYASNCGMYGARARYVNGKIASTEGKQYQNYTEITAAVEFVVGPRMRKVVNANVCIDSAGKFVMPKVFSTAEGVEHPFTKEAVAELLKSMQYNKPSREVHHRAELPSYKRPDKSRFNAG